MRRAQGGRINKAYNEAWLFSDVVEMGLSFELILQRFFVLNEDFHITESPASDHLTLALCEHQ